MAIFTLHLTLQLLKTYSYSFSEQSGIYIYHSKITETPLFNDTIEDAKLFNYYSKDPYSYTERYNRTPPALFEEWKKMATQLKCTLEMPYYDLAVYQLSRWFNSGLTRKILEGHNDIDLKYTLINGKLRKQAVEYGKEVPIPEYMDTLFRNIKFLKKSMVLHVNQHDEPQSDKSNTTALIFSHSSTIHNGDILMGLLHHISMSLEKVSDSTPFKDKESALFWRGVTTGQFYHKNNVNEWANSPRAKAFLWEKKFKSIYPHKVFTTDISRLNTYGHIVPVDIGFSHVVQCQPGVCGKVEQMFSPLKPFVEFERSRNFKYLLVIDGNGWAGRMQTYLQLNSVILTNRNFFDYYTWYLKPFVHFVPVREDLEDLQEKLQWLENNPAKALEIIKNAQAAMRIFGRTEQMSCHFAFILAHIEDLLKD